MDNNFIVFQKYYLITFEKSSCTPMIVKMNSMPRYKGIGIIQLHKMWIIDSKFLFESTADSDVHFLSSQCDLLYMIASIVLFWVFDIYSLKIDVNGVTISTLWTYCINLGKISSWHDTLILKVYCTYI